MKITAVIENTTHMNMPVEHGLCLYIEKKDGKRILFDMGQSGMFAKNAETLGLSIADVDYAVVSHGHYDHGGGLKIFLTENYKAPIYIHKEAFLPHYSLRETGLRYIGLDNELKRNERLILCDDIIHIDKHMMLFAGVQGNCCTPPGNRLLYGPSETAHDTFRHEQSLIVEEDSKVILFAGCAHCGIVNILRKMEKLTGKVPTHVFAGMHLVKNGLDEETENTFISTLAHELLNYESTRFYTMHCTGTEQYKKLESIMHSHIQYLSCGESVTI